MFDKLASILQNIIRDWMCSCQVVNICKMRQAMLAVVANGKCKVHGLGQYFLLT